MPLILKINPQQLAYLANPTTVVPIMPLLLGPFYLHKTHHVMALLSKSIAMTSEMSKTELVLHPDQVSLILLTLKTLCLV